MKHTNSSAPDTGIALVVSPHPDVLLHRDMSLYPDVSLKNLLPNTEHRTSCNARTRSSDKRQIQFLVSHLVGIITLSALLLGDVYAQDAKTIEEKWEGSPHAMKDSESFRHWNKDGEVPADCAGCHSMDGFLDYLGADGSAVGSVEKAHTTDTVVACDTCHNDALSQLPGVNFPSGVTITDTGTSTSCMACHQGRQSTVSVNAKLDSLPEDSISADLQFLNVHYRAAAATLLGTETQGGYEYAGKRYASKFAHPEPFDSCTGCHDPHALSVSAQVCGDCHTDTSENHLSAIRTTKLDMDGDNDTSEPIADELIALHEQLGSAITLYSQQISKQAVAYSTGSYPYFFNDNNSNAIAEADEAAYPNRYQSWTPRLLKAAYNYQFFAKDPGAWAHNPHYAAQLMIDSIADIATVVDLELPQYSRP